MGSGSWRIPPLGPVRSRPRQRVLRPPHRLHPAEYLLEPLPQPLIERIAACRGARPSMALERSLVSCATCGASRLASRDAGLLSSTP